MRQLRGISMLVKKFGHLDLFSTFDTKNLLDLSLWRNVQLESPSHCAKIFFQEMKVEYVICFKKSFKVLPDTV